MRALFRKKQAVAVKEESDKKEVKKDEGDVGEEEDCDNEEQEPVIILFKDALSP